MLGAGGKVVTLPQLADVCMTIFLPTAEAGRVALGAEARIVVDALPDYVLPASVSFVSPEAQFTPKEVETRTEPILYRGAGLAVVWPQLCALVAIGAVAIVASLARFRRAVSLG